MVDGLSSRLLMQSLLLLLLILLLGCCHPGAAFYPAGDDMNMDFLSNDSKAKADMNRMMLMNSDDPKLKAEAEEAFQEIMRAKRLSKLQECRRTCVSEHEEADEFRSCNEQCEATHKPGEYGELPELHGETTQPEAEQQTAKKEPEAEQQTAKKEPEAEQQTAKNGAVKVEL